MKLCRECHERPRHPRTCGGSYAYCLDCKRRINREQSKAKYAAQRGDAYVPQVPPVEIHVPLELRQELAGFARELGFGGAR